ncbi:MAG: STAS domain-containing protein [Schwartzia sp.]|nr:STAS domain-containing protein [Schwartzia sp. (in: firmicutes)]
MEIIKELAGTSLTLKLSGRLDTVAAADFDRQLDEMLNGVEALTLDCTDLAYVASSGLRTFLKAQKRMNKQGHMVLRHVNEAVKEVLSMTGFDDLLTIEK